MAQNNSPTKPQALNGYVACHFTNLSVAALSIILAATICLPAFGQTESNEGRRSQEASPAVKSVSAKYTEDEKINIDVYETGNRSVVNIQTESEGYDMFLRSVSSEGSGSGWVYDRSGHIVTNFHVVEGSDRIVVTLHDGQTSQARVVGSDPQNDIAVLKVEAPRESLIPLTLGDSADLKVGQKALAIGNPFGLERTLTVGIVSSLNRTLQSKSVRGRLINSVIQIDAALNKGNSGGPLFNSQGQVMGMNTAIASASGNNAAQNSGVGFAVPVNTIRKVVPELIANGKVIRASAGIFDARETTRGLMIVLVEPDGPAERAGLRGAFSPVLRRYQDRVVIEGLRRNETPGDYIQAIGGVEVKSWDELQDEVEKYKPGDEVALKIIRGRKEMRLNVRLTEE